MKNLFEQIFSKYIYISMGRLRNPHHNSENTSSKNFWQISWLTVFLISWKNFGGVNDKIIFPFKTMTTKNYSKSRKSRIKKQSDDKIIKATKDRIIRDIRNFLNKKNKIIINH